MEFNPTFESLRKCRTHDQGLRCQALVNSHFFKVYLHWGKVKAKGIGCW